MTRAERPIRFDGPDGLALTGVLWEAQAAPQQDAAEASRPMDVLFAPGNGFPVEAYRPLLAALPPHLAVHALNPRGHGGSAVPATLPRFADLAADLRAYAEQRMRPPVLLAGHSMGAFLALRLAAEMPALAGGVLLLEPPLRRRRGEAFPPEAMETMRALVARTLARRNTWASREEAAAWFAGSVLYRLWHADARAGFVEAGLVDAPQGGLCLATPPELEAALYDEVHKEDPFTLAAQARCAGVLLYGRSSVAVQPAALADIADALPVGAVVPVTGHHTFPMEHPAEAALRMTESLRLLRGETGLSLKGSAAARTG